MKRLILSEPDGILNEEVTALPDEIEDDLSSKKDQLDEDTDAHLKSPISESNPINTNSAIDFSIPQPHHSETQHNVESLETKDTMKINTISTEETSSMSKATDTMVTTTRTDSYNLYLSASALGALELQSATSRENEDAMLYEEATKYYSAESHASWCENHSSQYNEQMALA